MKFRTAQRLVGVVLSVGGVAVLMLAMNATHSVANQMSNTFTGQFTSRTMFYITAGLICIGSGIATLLFGDRVSKRS